MNYASSPFFNFGAGTAEATASLRFVQFFEVVMIMNGRAFVIPEQTGCDAAPPFAFFHPFHGGFIKGQRFPSQHIDVATRYRNFIPDCHLKMRKKNSLTLFLLKIGTWNLQSKQTTRDYTIKPCLFSVWH